MKHTFIRKPISILLSVLMALSVFGVTAFAGAPSDNTGGNMSTETETVTVGAEESVETLELTQHEGYFAGKCFSVAPGSMTDLYDYNNSWNFDGDNSLSEMGVTISALYGEAIRKVVVYAKSHWNSFWNGTPVAVAGDTTLTYTRDGNTFTFENVEASSVIIGASSGTGLMISKIDVYYADTDHDVVKTVRLIDAIGTVAYTTACKQKIDAAKAEYDALSDAKKAQVENRQKLTDAEAQYARLDGYAKRLVEITNHDADLCELGISGNMADFGIAISQADAVVLAQYLSARNANAPCAVLYNAEDGYSLSYVRNNGTKGEQSNFEDSSLNSFLSGYKVFYVSNRDPAVENVIALIDAIGAVELTDECKAKIDAARNAYDALTDAQKANVSNYETLQLAEGQYAALQLAADMTAFEAYKTEKKAAMDELLQEGDSETVRSIVGLAKTAIDGTEYNEDKTLEENKTALDDLVKNVPARVAEARAAEAALADAKEKLSDAIDSAKLFYNLIKDVEPYAAVADTLDTVIQQAEGILNSDSVEEILEKAEQLLAAVASAAEQKKAIDDKAAADEVAALIDEIGEVEYTDECKAKIDEARAAYDALTDDQKALVENADILTAAEEKYAELKAEAEKSDEPAKGGKIHGDRCFCYDYEGDGIMASLVRFLCAFFNFFMNMRTAIGA